MFVGGLPVATAVSVGNSRGASSTHQDTRTEGHAVTEGQAHSEGGAQVANMTKVRGHSLGFTEGVTSGLGGSETETEGETENTTFLAEIVDEEEWTGQYEEGTVADQKERNMVRLHSLRQAECFVSVYGRAAIPLKVTHVDLLWDTPEEAWHAAENLKARVAARWNYTFSPAAVPAALPPAPPSPNSPPAHDPTPDSGSGESLSSGSGKGLDKPRRGEINQGVTAQT